MSKEQFDIFDLSADVRDALAEMNFTKPTGVQLKSIPIMMEGHHLIVQAPTGTGKTIAFGIPILEYLQMENTHIQNLILCPTRELALQIAEELKLVGQFIKGLKITTIIGGTAMDKQIRAIKQKPQIVVATPGRLLDLLERKIIDLSHVYTLVLDEADEMFSMGFFKEVKKILDGAKNKKQIALFSATMSRDVMDIAWQYLPDAFEVKIQAQKEDLPPITQYRVDISEKDKLSTLLKILQASPKSKFIIFCNTKNRVRFLTLDLKKNGFKVDCLHSDIQQRIRNQVVTSFKNGKFTILVATDIAARGLDVPLVDGVINYEIPKENEYYLHRIGRTGRAKNLGKAYTFVTYTDQPRLEDIIRYTKIELHPFDLQNI